MVIHTPTALTSELLGSRQTAHIAPIIVREENHHIVRHAQALVVVLLHLLIECPHLRGLLGRALCHLADDAALILDHTLQKLDIGLLAHRLVAIATHTDRNQVLRTFGALDTLAEELVNHTAVGLVVPSAIFATLAGPLLVVTGHRFVVRGSHHDSHFIGQAAVLGIIGIEGPPPHGRPEEITAQTENQLKDPLVETVVAIIGAVGVFHPPREAGSFIIEEDTAITHGRFARRIAAARDGEVLGLCDRHIGPIVPGRNTDLLRELIDPIHRAATVTTDDHECLVNPLDRFTNGLHPILFGTPLQLRRIELSATDHLLYQGRSERAHKNCTLGLQLLA